MSRRSDILLFNSTGTCARCLGSRRRFNINMGFTDDNRILIENLYIFKAYVAKNIKEFPDKGWALSSLNKLKLLKYLNILSVCFASFFLASRDVITLKNFTVSYIIISMHVLYHRPITKGIYQFVANIESGTFPPNIIKIGQHLTLLLLK